jgi:hypothetical protein
MTHQHSIHYSTSSCSVPSLFSIFFSRILFRTLFRTVFRIPWPTWSVISVTLQCGQTTRENCSYLTLGTTGSELPQQESILWIRFGHNFREKIECVQITFCYYIHLIWLSNSLKSKSIVIDAGLNMYQIKCFPVEICPKFVRPVFCPKWILIKRITVRLHGVQVQREHLPDPFRLFRNAILFLSPVLKTKRCSGTGKSLPKLTRLRRM